jgi:thioester reductase-like protein
LQIQSPGLATGRADLANIAPRNELERWIANIWQKVLNIETIGVFDNFFDLGGHSLFASRLLTQLRQEFGIELPLSALFEATNIAELAQTIERVRQKSSSPLSTKGTTIDLWGEVKLDPAITSTGQSPIRSSIPSSILLTGATGFLGAFLLYELLQQTSASISCLVRPSGKSQATREAFQKLQTHLQTFGLWDEGFLSRLSVLVGDLALPQLGLSSEEFRQLAEQTDAIYHAGAWVNFTYPYSVLKPANVFGTQEILRLASLGPLKPVHFISTIAVFISPKYDPTQLILEDDSPNSCEELHTGYAESKWVAEKLVTEAKGRGIPVSIYRPAIVTGHSQTGVFNANDFVLRMLKSCIELKQAPALDLSMYIAPVDYVSKAIVSLSLQPHLLGKAFNLIPSQPINWQTLLDIVRSFGYPVQAISFADWYAALENLAQDNQETSLTPFLPLLQQQRMTSLPMLDCSNTLMGLKSTSLIPPPIDRELFSTYFDTFCRGLHKSGEG